MSYYLKEVSEVQEELNSSPEGLGEQDAESRLLANGKNRLADAKKDSLIKRFFLQMADPMIIMLIVAAGISSATALYNHESFTDVFIILFVVVLNAILGVLQESKAEKAIEALKEMSAATSKVVRDGTVKVMASEDIVVGDVIVLEAGDSVPADGRIIETASLKAEESALTGESVPVTKVSVALPARQGGGDIPLGDRKNMAYMGSTIAYGRGRMIVTATGMDTEMGKIAQAITDTQEGDTPLQLKLAEMGKLLSKMVIGISVLVFVISLFKTTDYTAANILHVFMIAVALAVAAIPEGLPAVVTIALSIGVTKMSRRNAIIRKLMAVESLGSTQIICSDKTGTLTQNKMTVTESFSGDDVLLARCMALCNDAKIVDGVEIGDPTETALINHALTLNLDKAELEAASPRVAEAPFDSIRKMMSTLHKTPDGKIVQYTKGAPDIILEHCDRYLDEGVVKELDEATKQRFLDTNIAYADRALRVLAGACLEYDTLPEFTEAEEIEKGMVFIGMTGMIDPSRPEVADAIIRCREAGISPIMITGDHLNTAVAIALSLGIITSRSQAMTGEELGRMSDEELDRVVETTFVYARVQPEHKVRIVNAWQRKHKVTAMTGDGVNDAPSIKAADIGVGMGITGTDVTKNVADMVLADDNFATIVAAVEEGRKIYDNIRKVLLFQISTNLAEVILVFLSSLFGFTIFETAHLLWINLVTDMAPGLALSTERAEVDIMRRAPRPSEEGIFAGFIDDIVWQGFCLTVIVFVSYFIGEYLETGRFAITTSMNGQTMAFLTMSISETLHSINMRSQRKSLFSLHYHNKLLYGAVAFSLVMTAIVVFIPPIRVAFGFADIGFEAYFIALGLSAMIIPLEEISKAVQRKFGW